LPVTAEDRGFVMEWWSWVLIGVAVVLAVLVVLALLRQRRRHALQDRFGPEYDRTVEGADSKRAAERALRDRERRHSELELVPLTRDARVKYTERWNVIQAAFVDEPREALAHADVLCDEVMSERGYPVGDEFEERADLVSVDHPDLVDNYRGAHLVRATEAGETTTEEMRRAFLHYRAMFGQLLADATEAPDDENAPSDRYEQPERSPEPQRVDRPEQITRRSA